MPFPPNVKLSDLRVKNPLYPFWVRFVADVRTRGGSLIRKGDIFEVSGVGKYQGHDVYQIFAETNSNFGGYTCCIDDEVIVFASIKLAQEYRDKADYDTLSKSRRRISLDD